MAKFVVGLRGGIGTGKSAVSDLFEKFGIVIADADVSARKVVEPGTVAFNAIVKRFGGNVLLGTGKLNRPALREIVFSNEADRLFLEAQTHRPIIEDENFVPRRHVPNPNGGVVGVGHPALSGARHDSRSVRTDGNGVDGLLEVQGPQKLPC